MSKRILLALLFSVLCCLPAAAQGGHFQVDIALQHDTKLGGCALGDLDPRHPGQEIVTVAITGDVIVLRDDRGTWRHETVFRCGGEALQCAVGDVLPSRPGMELLIGGMFRGTEEDGGPGAAHLVWFDGAAWRGQLVQKTGALVHGVATGIGSSLLVGFTKEAIVLVEREGALAVQARVPLPGNGKTAVSYQDGYLVACSDGSLVRVHPEGEGWRASLFGKRDAGRARIAAGPHGAVLSADDDGALELLGVPHRRIVHQEGQKLRGAAFGPFVRQHPVPGPQLASAGYEGRIVVLLPRPDGSHEAVPVFRDLGRFHHLCAGTIGAGRGRALIACGYTGRVVVTRWLP